MRWMCTREEHQETFSKEGQQAKEALELIHSDVCGRMPSSSINGYVYYVSFIDDYSRKTWIYFLKSKDEVFSKIKEFKTLRILPKERLRYSGQIMEENTP